MHSSEVRAHLEALALTPGEAARLLGVGLRTMRRWTQPDRLDRQASEPGSGHSLRHPPRQMPQGLAAREGEGAVADRIAAPAEQALRAWLKLHRLGEHWRPDGLALHNVDVLAALDRVRARSGPATHWQVHLAECVAKKTGRDPAQVSFVRHASGTFTLQTFCSTYDEASRRTLRASCLVETQMALVEDACATVARRLAGETEMHWPRLVLGAPCLLPGAVEMHDVSWRHVLTVRLPLAAMRTAWHLDLKDAAALAHVTRHHVLLAELASEVHARREPALSPDGTRVLEIDAGDLALMRARLQTASGPDALARAA